MLKHARLKITDTAIIAFSTTHKFIQPSLCSLLPTKEYTELEFKFLLKRQRERERERERELSLKHI